ncbi:MAG TPA: M90 family metallopeptidase [Gemmatimonadales bacterium]
MLSFLRKRRRARLRETPAPDAWERIVRRNVPLARRLSDEDRAELMGHVQVLVAEKHFEGCGGLVLTDEHRVTIAAQAAFLLLRRDTDYFPRLRSILVYPSSYVVEGEQELEDGIFTEGAEEYEGHTQEHLGALLLNWRDIRADARAPDDGVNLILHEFAHQLDFEDGDADGRPALDHGAAYERWARVLEGELARLRADVRRGRHTVLDPYGAEDPVEFFAVATEAFFETPDLLRDEHRALYDELCRFYRQDPARWEGEWEEGPLFQW